jgi:hypothetical protein
MTDLMYAFLFYVGMVICVYLFFKRPSHKMYLDSKKEAIAFAEWISKNTFFFEGAYYWPSFQDSNKFELNELDQLYCIYFYQKSKFKLP